MDTILEYNTSENCNVEDFINHCLELLDNIEKDVNIINNNSINILNKEESIKYILFVCANQFSEDFFSFIESFKKMYQSSFNLDNKNKMLSKKEMTEFNYLLNKDLNLINKLAQGDTINLLSTHSSNENQYGGSTGILSNGQIIVFLFKNEADPYLVYLHELGHILAYRITGNLFIVPYSFKKLVYCEQEEMYIELFANLFALYINDKLHFNRQDKEFNILKSKVDMNIFNKYFDSLLK